jgi:hypothetical protein
MNKPKQKQGLVTITADEQIIIFDPAGNHSHCLSAEARRVWDMCDGDHDRDDMILALLALQTETPDVNADSAEAVVDTVLSMFAEQNLLAAQAGMNRRDFARRLLKPSLAAALMVTLYVPSRQAHAS